MKMSAEQAKEDMAGCCAPGDPGDAPRYFYGLSFDVCDEALKALGVQVMPEANSTLMVTARVRVSSVRAEAQQDGVERSMCLQITDMALGPDTAKPSAEDRLYASADPD